MDSYACQRAVVAAGPSPGVSSNWTQPPRRRMLSAGGAAPLKTAPGDEAVTMQQPERFSDLPEYAFPRLRALLDPHAPGAEPVAMSLGEPRHPLPPFLGEALAEHAHLYGRYPPNEGVPELREAISAWLGRRYGLPEARRDPARHVFPLNGTREGLFAACLALVPDRKNGKRPAVLIPNPFYLCYAAAALAAGVEPVYVPATAETGFLPDYESLSA
jgi:Aspartate/tyrosine/aromatic aminotransferase